MTALRALVRFRAVKTPLMLALCAALAAGCTGGGEESAPPARTPPVLAGVPVYQGSEVVDTSGTAEAARATVLIPAVPDSVAAFYRRELVAGGWRIVGDAPQGGGTDIHAVRDGPPLWVQIRPGPQAGTTLCSLIGAVGAAGAAGDSSR